MSTEIDNDLTRDALQDWADVTRVSELLYWTALEEKRQRLFPRQPLSLYLRCGRQLAADAEDLHHVPRPFWTHATYTVFRSLLRSIFDQGSAWEAIDDWILTKETSSAELLSLSDVPKVVEGARMTRDVFRWTRKMYPGRIVLDAKRERVVCIFATDVAFETAFRSCGGDVLDGLEWTNVVAAGGVVSSTLHCDPDGARHVPQTTKRADIDLFLYGLTPSEAQLKVAHIWDVYCDNLPLSAPRLVVRNSQTITFYSTYEIRRVQIVLKVASSLFAILSNFDLDICAVAWDGTQIHMSPRFCRAIETGYNTFTMDIVVGHFLGRRRESRLQRIVKYAARGYGMRFLPKYCEDTDFDRVLASADSMVRSIIAYERGILPRNQVKIPFRRIHGARNPLGSLTLFLRHVVLWDMAQSKDVQLSQFAEAMHHDGDEEREYDDIASCVWDDKFDVGVFGVHIDAVNARRADGILAGLARARPDIEADLAASWPIYREIYQCKGTMSVQGVAELWTDASPSFVVPLPRRLAELIAHALGQVLPAHHSDPGTEVFPSRMFPLKEIPNTDGLPLVQQASPSDVLALYRCTLVADIAWELRDARRDEAMFLLETFRRIPWALLEAADGRAQAWVLARLLRRVPRVDWDTERTSFNRWCEADPISSTPFHGAAPSGDWVPNYWRDHFTDEIPGFL